MICSWSQNLKQETWKYLATGLKYVGISLSLLICEWVQIFSEAFVYLNLPIANKIIWHSIKNIFWLLHESDITTLY